MCHEAYIALFIFCQSCYLYTENWYGEHLSSNMFSSCSGHTEPLLVKFADGGNRKRSHFSGRQWVDQQSPEVYLLFEVLLLIINSYLQLPTWFPVYSATVVCVALVLQATVLCVALVLQATVLCAALVQPSRQAVLF